MADYKGVLICGDIIEGKVAAITSELLGWLTAWERNCPRFWWGVELRDLPRKPLHTARTRSMLLTTPC